MDEKTRRKTEIVLVFTYQDMVGSQSGTFKTLQEIATRRAKGATVPRRVHQVSWSWTLQVICGSRNCVKF